jgi:hypothetical protein
MERGNRSELKGKLQLCCKLRLPVRIKRTDPLRLTERHELADEHERLDGANAEHFYNVWVVLKEIMVEQHGVQGESKRTEQRREFWDSAAA